MSPQTDAIAADRRFFAALMEADVAALDRLLVDDFILVDVMRGGEIRKPDLLAVLGSGLLRFDSIEPADVRIRVYGDAAVINGRTRMRMTFGADTVEVSSRYTHVYVRQEEGWRFAAAQGTQIAPE